MDFSAVDPSHVSGRIRARIDGGKLPSTAAETVDARHGIGSRCHGCDRRIARSQIEYEFRAGRGTYRLHLACYIWWVASLRRTAPRRPASSVPEP